MAESPFWGQTEETSPRGSAPRAVLRCESLVCPYAAVPCRAVVWYADLRSCDPLQLVPLPFGGDPNNALPLWFVLVNPKFEAPTKEMRAVLPQQVGR